MTQRVDRNQNVVDLTDASTGREASRTVLTTSTRSGRSRGEPLLDTVELMYRSVPPSSMVLVVSRGDEALLGDGRVRATHFPRAADGGYAGHHPGSSGEAIAQLEALRAEGAEYLLFPRSSLWWLEYYEDLRRHLDQRYAIVSFDRHAGLVYELAKVTDGRAVVSTGQTPGTTVKRREEAPRREEKPAPLELTRDRPVEFEFSVGSDRTHLLRGALVGVDHPLPRAALVSVRFVDAHGATIPGPYRHLAQSKRREIGWYRYLDTGDGACSTFLVLLAPPIGSVRVHLTFVKWERTLKDRLFLKEVPSFEPTSAQQLADEAARCPDDVGLLRLLARLQAAEGLLSAHVTTLRRLAELAPSPQQTTALVRMTGMLAELDTTWLPTVPGRESLERREAGIRICHLFKVSYPFESSGGAIRNLNTVKSQRAIGLAPYVVTPLGYPRTQGLGDVEPEEIVAGVPHVRMPLPGDDDSLPYDQRLRYDALATAAVVRRHGADVIHAASGYRGYELALKGLALAKHFDLPFVYEVRSLHEHLWGPPTVVDKLDCEWTRLRMAQENRCMLEADVVVTLAEAMRDLLCERGIPRKKIVVVPNAVDEGRFQPTATDLALKQQLGLGTSTVVGYISNVSYREGHALLLRSFAALVREGSDVRCLIVGDGPERPHLETLAAALGVRDRVVFTGEIDHADVLRYYSVIDVFVVPRLADYASDYVTPLKPYEALALERAVVMADRPSLREIVGNNRRGRLFRTGDVDHLTASIRELVDRPVLRAKLGRRGRKWILRERTWRSNALRYRELYEQLLDDHRTRSAMAVSRRA